MPKATADFRAVRAVLSAPYPLPNIITRSAPSPSPEPIPAPLPVGPPPATDAQPIDAAYHGFPIFNARWRELPPAIPPIPYPTGAGGKKRRWRVKLNRVSKKEGESSEIELRSVVEGGPSRELEITRRMSEVSLGQFAERSAIEPSILNSVLQTKVPLHFFLRLGTHQNPQPSSTLPKPISQHLSHALNVVPAAPVAPAVPISSPLPGFPQSKKKPHPAHHLSSSDGLESDSVADADEEDQARRASPPSQRIQTPLPHRSDLQRAKRDKMPFFIGQTNLTPFTYHDRSQQHFSKSSAVKTGFASDASSIGTITRIPRSRYRRAKPEDHIAPKLSYETPPSRLDKGKERAMATSRSKEPLVSVPPPQNMSMPVPEYNSRHINVGPVPENTVLPALYPPYQQQCYRSPAQYQYLPSYSAPSMSNPPASSANPQHIWAPTPLPYTVNHLSGWNHSSGFQGKAPTPIPWTPKPMSIDPRSGDPRNPSWPHPLHTRETGQPYGKTLMPIAEVSMPSPPRRHRRALSAMQSSMTGLRRDVRHPSEPSARAPVVLPMAKACHNFLLARRMQSAKRKTQLRQHAKRMTQGTERPASPMHIDQYPSPHQVPPSTSIRPVSSIAHVVQGRPPVKRRREASPESHPLLSPAEITERTHAQREYQDCEADFTKMLNVAVQGQMSESQEREMRRAIWIEEEQRRAASAASSQGSKKKRSHRYGSHMR